MTVVDKLGSRRCAASVRGEAGETITLKHGEVLDQEGNLNLDNLRSARQTVNYTLKPVITDDIGVEGAERISGVPVPIKISGSLYEPDISVDVIAGLTGSQKAKLDKKKDELTGSLLDNVFGSKKDKKKKKKKDGG